MNETQHSLLKLTETEAANTYERREAIKQLYDSNMARVSALLAIEHVIHKGGESDESFSQSVAENPFYFSRMQTALEKITENDNESIIAMTEVVASATDAQQAYQQGIEMAVESGVIGTDLSILCEADLFDPTEITVVDGAFSGFGYRHLEYPQQRVGFDLSFRHAAIVALRYKEVVSEFMNISDEEYARLGLTVAVMHEYGHVLQRLVEIYLAQSDEMKAARGYDSVADLREEDGTVTEEFWELWEEIESLIVKTWKKSSDLGEWAKLSQSLGVDLNKLLSEMLSEGFAVGIEQVVATQMLRQLGLSEEKIPLVMQILHHKKQQQAEEMIGLKKFFDKTDTTALAQIEIKRMLADNFPEYSSYFPFYGFKPKQFGYLFPMSADSIKEILHLIAEGTVDSF